MKKIALVFSCEHAVDTVPKEYQQLFAPFSTLLASHRGIDFGAKAIAESFKKKFPCDLIQAQATRLLVDCNRSISHSSCFSEVTRDLPDSEKNKITTTYYLPFREQVTSLIQKHVHLGFQVWHLSIHSFTPVMNEVVRNAEIGFLYDPKRLTERTAAKQWQKAIKTVAPDLRVRRNYPYSGVTDGFTTALRKQFSPEEYLGIEVESNQAVTRQPQSLSQLQEILTLSLAKILPA